MFKWIWDKWIKFLKWMMAIKSIVIMGTVVVSLISFGYYLCDKEINPYQMLIKIYDDFMKVEIIVEEVVSEETQVDSNTVKIKEIINR